MCTLPIRRVVLYKHGVGYFEREAAIDGDQTESLSFKQREVSDVLKSLTVLDFYLKTQLASKKKDARTFTLFAQGEGKRTVRLSYVLEAPVWKATYRILLQEPNPPGPPSLGGKGGEESQTPPSLPGKGGGGL